MLKRVSLSLLCIIGLLAGCSGAAIFTPIDGNMSNPLTIAVDDAHNRLYINNSNYTVLYENGSFHVVDISDPTNPTLVDYVELPSFSGALYWNPVTQELFTPNRYSANDSVTQDNLYRIYMDEASVDFLTMDDYPTHNDAYGVACCDLNGRMLVASQSGYLDYYPVAGGFAHESLNLTTELSTGVDLSGNSATSVIIIGTQAYITRTSGGGLWVVNLAELGVAGKYPIDYFITDINAPTGITTDGVNLYVLDVETVNNEVVNSLLMVDVTSLVPRTSNTSAQVVSVNDPGMLIANIDLENVQPQQVILSGTTAYVSHFTDNVVSVVDTTLHTKTDTITVGADPYGMAIYSVGGLPAYLIVANSTSNTVSIIDLATYDIVATYP